MVGLVERIDRRRARPRRTDRLPSGATWWDGRYPGGDPDRELRRLRWELRRRDELIAELRRQLADREGNGR